VGDLSHSVPAPAPSVLEGFISEPDLARQLHRSVRTLQRLAATRSGPPRIKIGRSVYYKIESVRAWLAQLEKKPADYVHSSGRRLKRAS
jgi:predicted DNA-binding transcriptional regulator AlpA